MQYFPSRSPMQRIRLWLVYLTWTTPPCFSRSSHPTRGATSDADCFSLYDVNVVRLDDQLHSRMQLMIKPSVQQSLEDWWSLSGSNRRPSACKADALPAELRPRLFASRRAGLRPKAAAPPPLASRRAGLRPTPLGPILIDKVWWVEEDLNLRPHAYQACALTT